MDLVEQLVKERVSPASLLHQVTVTASADFVLCIEGWEDSLYYAHHLRQRRAGVKLDSIRCQKKKSVIWLMNALYSRGYRGGKILFFVDSDLDEFLQPSAYELSSLYLTDFYSFESNLVGEQCFDLVWTDLFGLPLRGALYDTWKEKYLQFMQRVESVLLIASATSIAVRRLGIKAYLNEVDITKRLSLTASGEVVVVGRLQDALGKSLSAAARGNWRSIRVALRQVSSEPAMRCARGKNMFAASSDFFATMRDAFLAPNSGVVCRRLPPFVSSHLLDTLAARLQCPPSLGDFIDAA